MYEELLSGQAWFLIDSCAGEGTNAHHKRASCISEATARTLLAVECDDIHGRTRDLKANYISKLFIVVQLRR